MKIGIDSNSLTYLIEVVEPSYDPNSDEPNLADERVAMVRLFLYGGEPFYVVPTVIQEYNKIKNSRRKDVHERFCQFLLLDGPWDLDSGIVNAKVNAYMKLHPKRLDCQVVAECEVGGLDALLTYDRKLLKRIGPSISPLKLITPSDLWNSLNIPRGSRPRISPDQANPLSNKKWWIW